MSDAQQLTSTPQGQDEGPCFTCVHSVNHITHGYCPKFDKNVRAMDGCGDFSETAVFYEPSGWLVNKPKVMGEQHALPTTKR